MTIKDILAVKTFLENETGLGVNMKKESRSSSMRGYVTFSTRKKKGQFTEWSFDFANTIRVKYDKPEPTPTFSNKNRLSIYIGPDLYSYELNPKKEKSEKQKTPKQMDAQQKPEKISLACRNPQQLRMDKAARRYAKAFKAGRTGVRYN